MSTALSDALHPDMGAIWSEYKYYIVAAVVLVIILIYYFYYSSSTSSGFMDPGITLTASAPSYRYITGTGWNTDGTPGVNSLAPPGNVTMGAVQSAQQQAQAAMTAANAANAAAAAPVTGASAATQSSFAGRMRKGNSKFNADNNYLQKLVLNQ
jgi:uncharacterized protein (UPF0333 family)